MTYIDVAIPLIAGVLFVTNPRLFTKSQGEKYEKAKVKLKTIGLILICIAVLYFIMQLFSGQNI